MATECPAQFMGMQTLQDPTRVDRPQPVPTERKMSQHNQRLLARNARQRAIEPPERIRGDAGPINLPLLGRIENEKLPVPALKAAIKLGTKKLLKRPAIALCE